MYIQILIDIVFGLTAISTFYFWLKTNRIAWKYKRYWPFSKKHMTADERHLVTKYQKWQFVCFFGGIGILILIFLLEYCLYRKNLPITGNF